MTSRQLRSDATISLTRSPRPMPSMLERTNTIIEMEMAACLRSMCFSRVPGVNQKLTAPDTWSEYP
jgi:hypothetical protein